MYDPYAPWIVLDFNDLWEPCAGDGMRLGLYYAETSDYTLLRGNRIYCNTILCKAKAEGIPFTATHQLLPRHTPAPRTLFKAALDAIMAAAGGMMKKLNNTLSGYLGKHHKNHYRVRLNSCLDHVWNWLQTHGTAGSPNIFVRDIGAQLFLLGEKTSTTMSEINMPMYIQLKDFANMRLYDMTKAMGGTLAFIMKVDCAVTVGGALPPLSAEWGGYCVSELPRHLGPQAEMHAAFQADQE
ncbi:hypothetical protein GPECTOR_90g531 [Gonium pectorale]|uniref:Uncharacterized protein n=1 Tax=Gonium pectorale TaxID=33097 RepID=A0A150G0T0_GONPE|nr:hypothetical protein GPECTOR_90g531 [Gonium pectorale]|eukprot:KXZ43444.1 hypothetical protein GPECTOR_90g531 [Gonium pectorale]